MYGENVTRKLDAKEALKLLKVDEADRVDKINKDGGKWPGSYNLKLIAQAVDKRRQFVELEPNHERFLIKYSERWKSAFLRPISGKFVPCGWFEYERLKHVLTSNLEDL